MKPSQRKGSSSNHPFSGALAVSFTELVYLPPKYLLIRCLSYVLGVQILSGKMFGCLGYLHHHQNQHKLTFILHILHHKHIISKHHRTKTRFPKLNRYALERSLQHLYPWRWSRGKDWMRFFMTLIEAIWVFPKIMGFPPKIIHFNAVFHYKPIHLGYPRFLETPMLILHFPNLTFRTSDSDIFLELSQQKQPKNKTPDTLINRYLFTLLRLNSGCSTKHWHRVVASSAAELGRVLCHNAIGMPRTMTSGCKVHGLIAPRKLTMEPENTPLEKENHLPHQHFQVRAVNLPGCGLLEEIRLCFWFEKGYGGLTIPFNQRYVRYLRSL